MRVDPIGSLIFLKDSIEAWNLDIVNSFEKIDALVDSRIKISINFLLAKVNIEPGRIKDILNFDLEKAV